MFILRALFALSAILFFISCGGGGSDDNSNDNTATAGSACQQIGLQSKIVNGAECTSLAASPIVRIFAIGMRNGEQRVVGLCTATMLTSNVALTASHCFLESANLEGLVGYGVVYGEADNLDLVPITSISLAPGYGVANGRSFNDIAVAYLSENIPVPTLPILITRDPEVGEAGLVYGYGSTDGNETDFLQLRAGVMSVDSVTADHIFVAFNGNGTNVCFGDSGGPILIPGGGRNGGRLSIAGVVSTGSRDDCAAGDVTTYTNLQNPGILSWLLEAVPSVQF